MDAGIQSAVHRYGRSKRLHATIQAHLSCRIILFADSYARIKAVHGAPEAAKLFGLVSRRAKQLAAREAVTLGKFKCVTWEEVLAPMSGVGAVIVCTETGHHAELARQVRHSAVLENALQRNRFLGDIPPNGLDIGCRAERFSGG